MFTFLMINDYLQSGAGSEAPWWRWENWEDMTSISRCVSHPPLLRNLRPEPEVEGQFGTGRPGTAPSPSHSRREWSECLWFPGNSLRSQNLSPEYSLKSSWSSDEQFSSATSEPPMAPVGTFPIPESWLCLLGCTWRRCSQRTSYCGCEQDPRLWSGPSVSPQQRHNITMCESGWRKSLNYY